MDNDVAVYLDLDNLLIGAIEANVTFDIDLILHHIKALTGGRLVLRRAYGDWRQRANMTRNLAAVGFELQSTVRLGSNSKNLADMQMVVDAMGTLVDGCDFSTYVLITGDRDFAPLVQSLRRRGKQVIGVGVKHTTSQRLVQLCDNYIFYDTIAAEANQQVEDQVGDLLQRALEQLLQDNSRVPASLLKQRLQSLSKGAFAHSPQGRQGFAKFLSEYPAIVQLQRDGTTLFARRPDPGLTSLPSPPSSTRRMAEDEIREIFQTALDQLLEDRPRVRASLLKQQMQDISEGQFDESLQGEKSFRKFLDKYRDLVAIEQEGSTLFVHRSGSITNVSIVKATKGMSLDESTVLLRHVLDDLLVDQTHVRASLLKQRMQELSDGVFDEAYFGDATFRQFLERFPHLVRVSWKGTTLMAHRPDDYIIPGELHLSYRSVLKKKGLRVVPSECRLIILRDMVDLLQRREHLLWRQMVDGLTNYYQRTDKVDISKSFVNDVLRVARRAAVIGVDNGSSLAKSPVFLLISGDRVFQEAVMKCDATYLREINRLKSPFKLEEVSLALYEDVAHTRYLQVLLNRFSNGDQPTTKSDL